MPGAVGAERHGEGSAMIETARLPVPDFVVLSEDLPGARRLQNAMVRSAADDHRGALRESNIRQALRPQLKCAVASTARRRR